MKKSKLIAGIVLMIVGLGVSSGSIVLRHYEHGRYSIGNCGVIRRGMMGGFGFGDYRQRRFNVNPYTYPAPPQSPKASPNQGQNPNTNPQPNQNQNQGQNSNGGVRQ